MSSRKIFAYAAAVALTLGAGLAQAATATYQLTDCNNGALCTPQFGNNFGTVTVTDIAGGVTVNVNLEPNYTWARTGLIAFAFTLASGTPTPTLSNVTATYWTPTSGSPLTSLNTDGMGTQQYGLDFTGPNDTVTSDLDFTLMAAGLTTASFVPGGTASNTGFKYYFLADICTDSDGLCSNQQAQLTGLVGGGRVPIPAAAWLLGSGLLGLFAVGRRRKGVQSEAA